MSTGSNTLEIVSPRVITPSGELSARIEIADGRIVAIERCDAPADAPVVLPGLVDPHVHLNEPGRTDWEGFETGTAAAAAGGITTLVDMPLNSSPVTTSPAALHAKRESANGKLSVDVGFHAGLVPGCEDEIAALVEHGVLGVKAFLCHSGIDEFPAATEKELRTVMPLLAERGIPLLVHAELVSPDPPISKPRRYADYLATRPNRFERDAIALLTDLCRETNCRTHIVHLADAGSLPMLREAKSAGLPLTVETCPHYLVFAADDIADGDTRFKCAPPIRDTANREGLWQGLVDGTIDLIATDHSPCPPEMKALESGRFDEAWGGISSLQLSLPIVWTEAKRRGHSLSQVVDWMCHRPAALVGIESGIDIGMPANLVLFRPDEEFAVEKECLHHRHKITPYQGHRLQGIVQATLLRGKPAAAGMGRAL